MFIIQQRSMKFLICKPCILKDSAVLLIHVFAQSVLFVCFFVCFHFRNQIARDCRYNMAYLLQIRWSLSISPLQKQQFGIHPWTKMLLWYLWDLAPYSKGPKRILLTCVSGNRHIDPGPSCGHCSDSWTSSSLLCCGPRVPGEHCFR